MMQSDEHMNPSQSLGAAAVRQNAMSAGIGAALLLFYGFFQLGMPTGDDQFAIGNLLTFYAMRGGGVLMAISALWSMTGMKEALLFDAVVSVLVGVGLTGGTLLMVTVDGGMPVIPNGVLYCIFAVMFVRAGINNGQTWALMWRNAQATQGAPPLATPLIQSSVQAMATPSSKPTHPPTPAPLASQPVAIEPVAIEPAPVAPDPIAPDPIEPPPEGFLAAFAPESKDDDRDA